jgi:hypothetical protein
MLKKLFLIFALIAFTVACEDDSQTAPEEKVEVKAVDSIQNYKGNFISVGNSAVLKGNQFVFQVHLDSVSRDLKKRFDDYSLENGTIVPVEVKGKVTDSKKTTGYSQVIDIKEVVKIFAEKKPENEELKK